MWRHGLGSQRWAAQSGCAGLLADQKSDSVGAQCTAVAPGKQQIAGLCGSFSQPSAQHSGGLRGQWGDAFLAAFPEAPHVRTRSQDQIGAAQGSDLGNS
jgi:hypothetical protein